MKRITILRAAAAIPAIVSLALAQDGELAISAGAKAKSAESVGLVDLYSRQMPLTVAMVILSLVWLWAIATWVYLLSMDRSGPARAAKYGWLVGPLAWVAFVVTAHYLLFLPRSGA